MGNTPSSEFMGVPCHACGCNLPANNRNYLWKRDMFVFYDSHKPAVNAYGIGFKKDAEPLSGAHRNQYYYTLQYVRRAHQPEGPPYNYLCVPCFLKDATHFELDNVNRLCKKRSIGLKPEDAARASPATMRWLEELRNGPGLPGPPPSAPPDSPCDAADATAALEAFSASSFAFDLHPASQQPTPKGPSPQPLAWDHSSLYMDNFAAHTEAVSPDRCDGTATVSSQPALLAPPSPSAKERPGGALRTSDAGCLLSSASRPDTPVSDDDEDWAMALSPDPAQMQAAEELEVPLWALGRDFVLDRPLQLLGVGVSGRVVAGTTVRCGRQVAVKLLPMAHLPEAVAPNLAAAARAAAACRHTARLLGLAPVRLEAEAHLALAMQRYPGSLPALMREQPGGCLGGGRALLLARDLLHCLVELHAQGLAHGDLKPSNVLLDSAGAPLLCGLGLARLLEAGPEELAGARGPECFTAPEQQGSTSPPSPPSDMWGLGATLAFAATGQPPVCTEDAAPQGAAPLGPELPPPLRWLVTACGQADPAARPTAVEALRRIEGALLRTVAEQE
ncbi:hypothetical protein HYH03_017090 [Edaphochlamys debaryana]|uniref:NEK6-subfamily protein kinase n=1 Tax=Edaphochlamys debaryana TaxID=47281 RepID=A0A835XKS5_9CHLO|nr:hypothetical protein HYH03_017090 [Edaphochlamys debaryana]|eukprot:KAG2484071.1 hypothetical protein HYH03_017090 [Edaphochlamys debaryana]